jgi:hypothetical protein
MSDPQRKTVWTCQVSPDRTVRLEDIPARQLAELEQKFSASWIRLVSQPFDVLNPNVEQALAMYEKCCAIAGVEPKDLTAGQLSKIFELVDDDRPDQFTEGQIPKAAESPTAG